MPNTEIYHLLIKARIELQEAFTKNYQEVSAWYNADNGIPFRDKGKVLKKLSDEYHDNFVELEKRIIAAAHRNN